MKTLLKHRYGGGIGEYFDGNIKPDNRSEPDLWLQFFIFNMLFFISVNIILLNIIFGVIIDTFSSLREELNTKLYDMRSFCFICSLSRETLEHHCGFQFHIKEEHNMWQYLYYIVYLRSKDPDYYTGSDQYVMNIIKEEGISWLPLRRALSIKETISAKPTSSKDDTASSSSYDSLAAQVKSLSQEVKELKGSNSEH